MNKNFVAVIIGFLACLCGTAIAGEVGSPEWVQYVHLEHDKKHKEAIEFLIAREQAGDGWAKQTLMERYNDILQRPDSVPKEARPIIEAQLVSRAESGDAKAEYVLGMKYLMDAGKNVEDRGKLLAKGVSLLDKVADQGGDAYTSAMLILSQMDAKALDAYGIKSRYISNAHKQVGGRPQPPPR